MKKFIVFTFLFFAVFAFAAPPPDIVSDMVTEQSAYVVQDNQNFSDVAFEVQEVAFVYLGNVSSVTSQSMFIEPVYKVKVPEALVMIYNYNLQGLSRPPTLTEMKGFGNNFRMNMQNNNYGYPLTGDTYRS